MISAAYAVRRQRLYTIQNQVTLFLISINTINIHKYVNNKKISQYCPTAHSPFLTELLRPLHRPFFDRLRNGMYDFSGGDTKYTHHTDNLVETYNANPHKCIMACRNSADRSNEILAFEHNVQQRHINH